MKRVYIFLAACALMAGCVHVTINNDNNDEEYGPAVTRVYTIDGTYDELEVSHAFDVTMSDTATAATVTIGEALHDRVVFRVEEGTLKIGLKTGHYKNINKASVVLPVNRSLCEIELSGASSFTSDINLTASEISIDLSGAAHFDGSIEHNGELDVELSGASTATITGTTYLMEIDISGASTLDASDLDATTVKGEVSGASTASALCCDLIKVDVSGASHLSYSTIADGCTPKVDCPTSGASSVTRLNNFNR